MHQEQPHIDHGNSDRLYNSYLFLLYREDIVFGIIMQKWVGTEELTVFPAQKSRNGAIEDDVGSISSPLTTSSGGTL